MSDNIRLPKDVEIGEDVEIHPDAKIDVRDRLIIGDRTVVNAGVEIMGRRVELGRECWLAEGATIGGGSCFGADSRLLAGDWLHMGRGAHVNTARGVVLGDEVGLGRDTRVYTHGAYLSGWDGYPVSFKGVSVGDRAWLPAAIVNPGVSIGSDVVVAAMSVVERDLPAGCLAGGVPVRVLRQHAYPRTPTRRERLELLNEVMSAASCGSARLTRTLVSIAWSKNEEPIGIKCEETMFNVQRRTIRGPVSEWTEALKNELRRHGIRFRYTAVNGDYVKWD